MKKRIYKKQLGPNPRSIRNERQKTRYEEVLNNHFDFNSKLDLTNATASTINELRDAMALQNSLPREQLIKLYAGILFDLANSK